MREKTRAKPASKAKLPPEPDEPTVPNATIWLAILLLLVAIVGMLLDSAALGVVGFGGLLMLFLLLRRRRAEAAYGAMPELPMWARIVAGLIAVAALALQYGPQAWHPPPGAAETLNQAVIGVSLLVILWPAFLKTERAGRLRQWRGHS